MSLKLKPLPPRESSTSLYRPIASANALPPSAAKAAEIRKCLGKSSRPASVTVRGAGTGQSRAAGVRATSPRPLA